MTHHRPYWFIEAVCCFPSIVLEETVRLFKGEEMLMIKYIKRIWKQEEKILE